MSTWGLITLGFGYCVSLILYARYTFISHIPLIARIGWLIVASGVGYIPFFVWERSKTMSDRISITILYFIFITAVILLTLTILTDIIWGIGYLILKSKMIALPSVFLLMGISLLLSGWALYEGTKVPTLKHISLTSDKITEPTTLVFLSDLHLHHLLNPQKSEGIINTVNALQPDIVILGGDTIDDRLKNIQPLVTQLKNIQARSGRFFVVGNHEYYYGFQSSVEALQQEGFTFLYNTGKTVKSLYIAGIPDMTADATSVDLTKAFETASPSQFRILVSHTPTDFNKTDSFDLELAGHTHGGQIFPFHILTKLHNPYISGLYKLKKDSHIYTSRGSGQWGPQMRFLAPAEITVIHLKPK